MKQLKISGEISTLSESVDARTLYKTDSTNLDIPTYDLVDKVSSNTRDNYTYISVLSLSKYFVRNKSLCSLQGDIESGGKYGFELLKDKQAFNQIKSPKNFSFADSNYTNIGGYAFTFSEYSGNNLESFFFTGTNKAIVKIGGEEKNISSSRFPWNRFPPKRMQIVWRLVDINNISGKLMRVGGTDYTNTTSSDFSLTTSPVIGGDYPIGPVNSGWRVIDADSIWYIDNTYVYWRWNGKYLGGHLREIAGIELNYKVFTQYIQNPILNKAYVYNPQTNRWGDDPTSVVSTIDSQDTNYFNEYLLNPNSLQEFIDGDNKDIYEGNTGNKKYFTSSSKVTPHGASQTSGDYYLDTSSNKIHKGSFRYVQGNHDVESFDTYLFGKIPLLKGENSSQIKFSNLDTAYWYPYDSPGTNNQEGILLDYMTNIRDVQLGAILPLGYISIKSGTIPNINKADHLECYNGNRTNCYIYHRCEFGGEYHKSGSIDWPWNGLNMYFYGKLGNNPAYVRSPWNALETSSDFWAGPQLSAGNPAFSVYLFY